MSELREAALTAAIIKTFYRIYDELGFGLLESVYANSLEHEFKRAGIPFDREAPVEAFYHGHPVGHFRADFIIAGKIILEVKASRSTDEADRRQLLNYMRCSRIELGIMLHFGPKPSFHRLIFDNDRKTSLRIAVNS